MVATATQLLKDRKLPAWTLELAGRVGKAVRQPGIRERWGHLIREWSKRPTVDNPLPLHRPLDGNERVVVLAAIHDAHGDASRIGPSWDWEDETTWAYMRVVNIGVPQLRKRDCFQFEAILADACEKRQAPKVHKGDRYAGLAKRVYEELIQRIKTEQSRIRNAHDLKREPAPPTRPTQKQLAEQFGVTESSMSRTLKKHSKIRDILRKAFNDNESVMRVKL